MRRISVVIPSFNHARFVEEAIRSVAAQRVPDLELIVVDDGSSDASPEIIRRTLDQVGLSAARFLEHSNRGAHATIARGVEASSGELIAILNSDDRYHPDRFVRMLPHVPESGDFIAFSLVRMIGAAGEVLDSRSPPVLGYRHALYEASRCPTIGFGLLRNNFAVSTGNFLFTRTLYDKIGGFADLRLAHDWDFLLQALVYVEPILVTDPLLDYRTHGLNERLQITGDAVTREGRRILERYLQRCAESPPDNPLAPCEANWPIYFDLFVARYHAWFGEGAIRDWMGERAESRRGAAWRPWSDALESDRVDDCDYLTDPTLDPARRTALALAREVLLSEAHPLAEEEGAGPLALREVYARHVRALPRTVHAPWKSPIVRTFPKSAGTSMASKLRELVRARSQRLVARATRVAGATFRLARGRKVIRESGVFDVAFYTEQLRALGLETRDPILHYLRKGAALGLDPHPLFDTRYYELHYPDVRAKMNPLVHYLLHGDAEDRRPGPGFDPAWYRTVNPDVARSRMNTLSHWCLYGEEEGRFGHPRFDAKHYLEQLGEERLEGNLWTHYLRAGSARGYGLNKRDTLRLHFEASDAEREAAALDDRARDARLAARLRIEGLFDDETYRHWWGRPLDDVSDVARHFVERGSVEGVYFCREEPIVKRMRKLESALESSDRPELSLLRSVGRPLSAKPDHTVWLFVSSHGNAFFREMAEILAAGFRSTGASVRLLDETYDGSIPDDPKLHSIVVAPHEFFVLGEGSKRASRSFLGRSSLWIAEQPGSEFFAMCLWFSRYARRLLDINPLTALAWGRLGVPALALPLGWVADLPDFADRLEFESNEIRAGLLPEAREPVAVDAPLAERPIDVCFNGVLTERREAFFARNAFLFSQLRCAFFMPSPHSPVSKKLPSALGVRDATALAQRSRILLNVHRGEMPYLEWHRLVVRGIWQKALVVSEPSFRIPGFEPGLHYVECELDEMPERLEWLLRSESGRSESEAIRTRAFAVLKERFPLRDMVAAFLDEDSA